MRKYRIVTIPSGKPHSEWRANTYEATCDAVDLELADWDDEDPTLVHWDPVTAIEYEDADGTRGIIDPR